MQTSDSKLVTLSFVWIVGSFVFSMEKYFDPRLGVDFWRADLGSGGGRLTLRTIGSAGVHCNVG